MKVYFATAENQLSANEALIKVGVRYRLISFYYILNEGWLGEEYFSSNFTHVIIDSGLFTIMFGKESKNKMTYEQLIEYKEKYFTWIATIKAKNFSFVELDVQKVYSPELAWVLRKEMRERLPDKDIINVYHLEDKNPNKLINFANYIAIGMTELKLHAKNQILSITNYIVNTAKSKGKKVHILGMSGKALMEKFKYADTCDSTNWTWYRRSKGYKKNLLQAHGIENGEHASRQLGGKKETLLGILTSLKLYEKYAGSQK